MPVYAGSDYPIACPSTLRRHVGTFTGGDRAGHSGDGESGDGNGRRLQSEATPRSTSGTTAASVVVVVDVDAGVSVDVARVARRRHPDVPIGVLVAATAATAAGRPNRHIADPTGDVTAAGRRAAGLAAAERRRPGVGAAAARRFRDDDVPAVGAMACRRTGTGDRAWARCGDGLPRPAAAKRVLDGDAIATRPVAAGSVDDAARTDVGTSAAALASTDDALFFDAAAAR